VILVAAALIGMLTVPLAGGQLSTLAQLPFRAIWAVWASIAIQVSITVAGAHVPATVAEVLHIASYALAAWCIWANRRLPGLWLVAVGGAMNLSAIVANGGSMPATAWAWRTSGLDLVAPDAFENSMPSSGSPLWFFGDVGAVPKGWPLANVFSVGDVVIVAGLLVLAHRACRPTAIAPAPALAAA
jgi:hypothetical protein